MTQPDPRELFVLMMRRAVTQEIVQRTKAKAKRGAALRQWALGVPRSMMDAKSSLALDDRDFVPEYAPGIVSTTAVFPVMAGIDSLIAVGELIEGRDDSEGRTGSGMGHAVSLLTLCRQATEASARTIWLLSSTDRAVRRNLTVRFSLSEMDAQKGFHRSSRIWFGEGGGRDLPAEHEKFSEHVRLFDKRVEVLEQARHNTPKVAVLGSKDLVESSARWLDQNPPRHEPNGPFGREGFGFEQAAGSFYGVSSGIVHALKWITDYMPNSELDLYRVIVESVNNAVCMAECAVALFEAQARDWHSTTDRPRLYPELLQPSIDQWAELYPVEPADR
jgi:hypothetical protein